MAEDEMSTEDLTEYDDMRIDTIIQILIDKKIITEEEFEKKFNDLYPDES